MEDTNALALSCIAAQNSRPLAAPMRTYITGFFMGVHIAATAVQAETLATAVNKVRAHANLLIYSVAADTELYNRFASRQVAAQALAGVPDPPLAKYPDVQLQVSSSSFTSFPDDVKSAIGLRAQIAATPSVPVELARTLNQYVSQQPELPAAFKVRKKAHGVPGKAVSAALDWMIFNFWISINAIILGATNQCFYWDTAVFLG